MNRKKRIYINKDKFFDNVTPELWNYRIGGYQVLHKYLKDRQHRMLEDPRHFCRVITALHEAMQIQDQIDEIFDSVEKEVIEF